MERVYYSWLQPIQRRIGLAFLQDFALDPEESRMRAAAHHMVRFMTAGMALITCREPLLISINNNLRSNFLAALRVRRK